MKKLIRKVTVTFTNTDIVPDQFVEQVKEKASGADEEERIKQQIIGEFQADEVEIDELKFIVE